MPESSPLVIFLPTFYPYIFVLARLASVMITLPGMSDQHVPVMVRIGCAMALTLAYAFPHSHSGVTSLAPILFLLTLMGEVMIGFAAGLLIRIFFSALDVAGSLIGFQVGLANVMMSSPASAEQSALTGAFLTFVAMTLFFVSDLYAVFLGSIGRSFDVFPPGGFKALGMISDGFFQLILKAVSASFYLAAILSGPILIVSLLISLGSAILSRLVPQIQIFFITQPLLILLGFLLMYLTLGPMMKVIFYFLNQGQLFLGGA